MKTSVIQEFQQYWIHQYDWRKAVKVLNRFPAFLAKIDEFELHFVHLVGEAKGRRPLLLIHGWLGSFYEFWQCAEPLAFPSKFGGKAEDAFDLINPSLPGYGFSHGAGSLDFREISRLVRSS